MRGSWIVLLCICSFAFLGAQNCDTLRLTEIVCDGEILQIGDSTFSESGNYEIRIPQGNCDSIILLTAVFRTLPEVFIDGDTTFCEYSTTLSANNTFSSYLWSTGETTSSIEVDTYGTYCITATNSFGCANFDCVEVERANMNLGIFGDTIFCPGFNTSLIADPADGVAPFSYSWSGPDGFSWNLDVVNATIPGTYCLEVFDSRGCFETACKTISIFQETLLTDTIITAGTSIGGGGVDITLDSVSAPYLYFWSNGRISQDLVNVPFGNYQVTIVDKNDCPTVRLFNVPLRTSTNDSQISKCEIFPSLVKAGNLINLNCADVNPSRAQIFNLQGQESALINIEENQIKLPADLPMGTYLLKIYSLDGLIKVEKIVIY
jgi:hypothetical protein